MNLIKELKKKNILKFGNFTLRSGLKANYYCDIKEAFGDPNLLNLLIGELLKIVPKNTTCIAGSGYGGITLASLIAYKTKLPLTLVRDKVKDHGTKKIIDGYVPKNKDRVCVVDDVFTTGSCIKEVKEKLAFTKTKFTRAVVVLNRSGKSKNGDVFSLVTGEEVSNSLD